MADQWSNPPDSGAYARAPKTESNRRVEEAQLAAGRRVAGDSYRGPKRESKRAASKRREAARQ